METQQNTPGYRVSVLLDLIDSLSASNFLTYFPFF